MSWEGMVFAGLLGAVMGSFANACIYRMPRGIGLWNPRRSFCPNCGRTIRWFENLPVVSYVFLRGRCAGCGWRIPLRYLVVEVVMAGLFVALAWKYGLPLALGYWVLATLLVIGSWIDWEFLILPDEVTVGGAVLGVGCSVLLEGMHGGGGWVERGGAALLGVGVGVALLWGVVEGGKWIFGKRKVEFRPAAEFFFRRKGEGGELDFEGEALVLEEVLFRRTDEVVVECERVEVGGRKWQGGEVRFRQGGVVLPDGAEVAWDGVREVRGAARAVVIPREAMGFGDVKLMAAVGAFLGWQGVLFTIFIGSVVGAVVGAVGMLVGRTERGAQLPFGPYLALGAVGWVLGGEEFWRMYWQGVMGGGVAVGGG